MSQTRAEKQKEIVRAYQEIFLNQNGKLVLKDLRKLAKLNVTEVPLDSLGRIDPYEVMRNEGKRAVLVHIEKQLDKIDNTIKQEKAKL